MSCLVEHLKDILFSGDFCQKHKKNPQDFTRTRLFPFASLIIFLLNMNNNSYQAELDHYFQIINHLEVAERFMYKGSLSKARAKLKPEAFIDLNDHLIGYFYDNFHYKTWHGFRLVAVDGTTLRVPDTNEIIEHFGVWNSVKGEKPCPKARASQMFDVLNDITVDAIISPKGVGERELAAAHFKKLTHADLVLLDRGYPAFWLFKKILTEGGQFCARISYNTWKIIKKFYKSNNLESIVTLSPTSASIKKCIETGLDIEPMKLRLIRVELDSGETEILVTSLTDGEMYPHVLFSDLYHLRWPIEEDYKVLKYRIEIENFSGKTKHSVYQDFHAKLFSKNFSAVVGNTTKDDITEKSKNYKYPHKLNFTQALARMKDTIVLLFHRPKEKIVVIIEKIRKIFIQTTEAVRPNRKFPRRHRVKQKRFHYAYKTTC